MNTIITTIYCIVWMCFQLFIRLCECTLEPLNHIYDEHINHIDKETIERPKQQFCSDDCENKHFMAEFYDINEIVCFFELHPQSLLIKAIVTFKPDDFSEESYLKSNKIFIRHNFKNTKISY